jgi:hypothetical protein
VRRLTVPEAAEALGITTDAVRMRLSRGTLDSERVEGRVYVLLEDDASPDRSGESSDSSALLISEMRDQIEFLRRELERRDQLLAAALSRIPEASLEAPSEPRESPVTAESPGPRERGDPRAKIFRPLPTRRGHRRAPGARGGGGCSASRNFRENQERELRLIGLLRTSPVSEFSEVSKPQLIRYPANRRRQIPLP